MFSLSIYPTLPSDQIAYILKDSGAVAIFVSNRPQAEKIKEIRGLLPALRTVIGFDEIPGLTDFSMAEVFAGLMLPMIKGSLPDFGPPFEQYASDLKSEAERSK